MTPGRASTRPRRIAAAAAAALALVLLAAPASSQAVTGPGSAVVLVSGFDTVTPFSTPNPSCAGKEGPAWSPAGGVAATLKAAGYTVFTAPVMHAGGPPATPCAPGTATPPLSDYINSNGDLNANGAALGRFLAFLNANYGVTQVDLVAHSDGGLWSRAAITQRSSYPNVTVASLTTLGTPHTGSFIADLAEDFSNGQCKEKSKVAQLICLALQNVVQFVVNDLGELAVNELSSDFLATWNPEQRIGSCPVTGIAGTFFNFPLPPSILPAYYNPSDGLVGRASALGQASNSIYGNPIPAPGIPNFTSGGEFPVVHGTSFAFLTKANLLDTQAVSNAVLAALNAQTPGSPPCTTTSTSPTSSPATLTDGLASITVPLHHYRTPRRGVLPRPRRGDLILARKRARVFCGRRRLRTIPFLGNRKLRMVFPRCKRKLRVRGKGRVLLIRTRGSATIQINGTTVTIRVNGVRARRVSLSFEGATRFVGVALNQALRGILPAGSGPITLRVIVQPRRGGSLSGSATVSR